MKGPIKVWTDIYQIGGPEITGSGDCCVYLVDAGTQLLLIDSGAGKTFENLIQNIRKLELEPDDLNSVVATHGHIDHIGALTEFKDKYGVDVIAHEPDIEWIETGKNTVAEAYNMDYHPCKVDVKLSGEREERSFGEHELTFLHIPGHTPGSIACYVDIEGKRVLFGQDIHGPYNLPGADRKEAKKSLKKLISLKADILCEGHSGTFEPAESVKRYIENNLAKF